MKNEKRRKDRRNANIGVGIVMAATAYLTACIADIWFELKYEKEIKLKDEKIKELKSLLNKNYGIAINKHYHDDERRLEAAEYNSMS